MPSLLAETVGILPAGALGVSLYYHLTGKLSRQDGRVFFLERAGSASAQSLMEGGGIRIALGSRIETIAAAAVLKPDLLACHTRGELPEIILACPNPDQLLGVITTAVELLERLHLASELELRELPFPRLVLCSNGIYFQRLRQMFIEKIEEATLLGRLPDLWPDLMPRIVGRLLRGVTIQTGVREGGGAETLYHPGPPGITRLAGGDAANRERCFQVLHSRGMWIELAPSSSATRLEFDKAIINLLSNLLGQLYAIDDRGNFQLLTVAEIAVPAHDAEMRELARRVFQIGQAVKAYGPQENFEALYATLAGTFHQHASHVPSSLQWVGLRLRLGRLEPAMTPTEIWLIEPLIRYARSAGLDETVKYFEDLKQRLMARLTLASQAARPSRRAGN